MYQINVQLLIEDSYETCKEVMENGIKAILMKTKMNAGIEEKEIIKVCNRNEIYNQIKELKSN